ncbi:MAG TPA: glycosyltransferase family 4 protein [Elusimicrobiales bacterium]|nr:glycosyltransferase family 4 protein [Elusimicrobiales bacterium]
MDSKQYTDLRGVVFLLPSVPPRPAGGAELQALKLASALARRGERVFIVSEWAQGLPECVEQAGVKIYRPHGALNVLWKIARMPFRLLKSRKEVEQPVQTDYSGVGDLEKNGLNQRRLGWGAVPYVLVFFVQVFLFLLRRRSEFDVIHAHHAEWDGFMAVVLARLLGKKALVKDSTINGLGRLKNDAFGWRMQACLRDRAYFAAMTGAIARNLEACGVPQERIFRIPNGVELPAGRALTAKPLSCLFVGNLTQQPAKGLDVLLKAWPQVPRDCPGAELRIVGGGDSAPYQEFAAALGVAESVRFFGAASELDRVYSEAAVFLLPSRREGMPNALLEAMAHGLPCVASAIPGMEELVEDGRTGLLVPPEDAQALAVALMRLLKDPELSRRLGEAARLRAVELFSMETISARYGAAYRAINGVKG